MPGSKRFLPAIALGAIVCVVLCLRGPVPPALAIKSAGDSRNDPDSRKVIAKAHGELPAAAEDAAIPETADAAALAILRGLHENRPDILWDALPASYQRDVNDLVHLFANRLNPEGWRWFLRIASKGATLLRTLKETDLVREGQPDDGKEDARPKSMACDRLATSLDELSRCGPEGLEALKTIDIAAAISSNGHQLMLDLRQIFEGFSVGMLPRSLEATAKGRVSLKDTAGDVATVEIRFPNSSPREFELVRVEGKWIPCWLAANWSPAVVKTRRILEQALPAKVARDNFGPTFQILAAIDFALDNGLAGLRGEDTDSLLAGFLDGGDATPSVGSCLVLLGYLMGGPPTTEPDFDLKTKQSLVGKDKVVLVYCYAGKELKWDNESVDYDLAKGVGKCLTKNKINVIDSEQVQAWLEKNDSWSRTAEIGAAFKADYVVHIDLKDCSLYEAHSANQYRGKADLIVNVVKMDDDRNDGQVIFATAFKSRYPTRSPVDANVVSYAKFREYYLSALGDEIGQLFYPHSDDRSD